MNQIVYIIMYTTNIGGAEKRFTELWLSFQKIGYKNIKLVLPKELFDNLIENSQLQIINQYKENIIFIERTNKGYYYKRKKLIEFVNKYNQDNAIFHFILMFPIFTNYSNNYNSVFTYPATSFKALGAKGLFTTFFSFLESNKIDVLDPRLTKKAKLLFVYKKDNITNTPSSFINTNDYQMLTVEKKNNWLVFLGRFEKVKQLLEFLETIPLIDKKLKENNIFNHEFFILGKGSLEKEIYDYVNQSNDYKNIKMHIYFEKEPMNILKYSKVFFSLQKFSNYPSKSLLEAISCGNLPIVTDNGDTRKIADANFSYFVKENFSGEELSNKCLEILTLNNEAFTKKCMLGVEHIKENFNINQSVKYFLDLYENIKEIND